MLLPQKLSTYARSRIVTNTSLKRGTSKCIYAHIQEIVPSNAATAENVSQVLSGTTETMSGDIVRKSKFIHQLYIFKALPMRELRVSYFRRYILTTHMKTHHSEVFNT